MRPERRCKDGAQNSGHWLRHCIPKQNPSTPPQFPYGPSTFLLICSTNLLLNLLFSPTLSPFKMSLKFLTPQTPIPLIFLCLGVTAKQRKRKLKSRQPLTPITSKVKKIKMKCYSSFKGRFRVMNDGEIRRWKEGKWHNAHLESKKARCRLRRPGTVPLAYAKVMKKLNFSG